jgi:hypothetical protein
VLGRSLGGRQRQRQRRRRTGLEPIEYVRGR